MQLLIERANGNLEVFTPPNVIAELHAHLSVVVVSGGALIAFAKDVVEVLTVSVRHGHTRHLALRKELRVAV